jgi:hypothetical protein
MHCSRSFGGPETERQKAEGKNQKAKVQEGYL